MIGQKFTLISSEQSAAIQVYAVLSTICLHLSYYIVHTSMQLSYYTVHTWL